MLGVGRSGARRRADQSLDGGAAPAGIDGAERDAWVVLDAVQGVGPVTFARLIAGFGSARGVLGSALARGGIGALVAASRGVDGDSPAVTEPLARSIADAAAHPELYLGPVSRAGVTVLTLADPEYPARLRRVDLPPPVLFVRGSIGALDRPRAIALVGTRRPTSMGRGTAGRIADAVAGLGSTVVSGLALGIDSAAHAAAVGAGGTTVAVIGGGHARLYPSANRVLADRIVRHGGAVISEFHPETSPSRGTFPRRNRIISGLADATVVVEAGARSGALTTAAWALEQGRGLYIVPGRLEDPAVAGCLAFLREAGPEARIVAGVPELLEDLGLVAPVVPGAVEAGLFPAGGLPTAAHPGTAQPAPSLDAVLAALRPVERELAREIVAGKGSVDELVATTGLTGATVLGALTTLEMRGLVVETFGRYRPAGALARAGVTRPAWRAPSGSATLPATRQPTPT
jgi:DNA processing protein